LGCTPPSANWSFPLSSCAIGFIGSGTWANGCTGSLVPLNTPDYHSYGLAGGPYNQAPDNSSLPIGAIITGGALSIDYLQTTNLYPVAGCPNGTTSCPFPDVLGVAPQSNPSPATVIFADRGDGGDAANGPNVVIPIRSSGGHQ
jgi:hypothetical protein